MKRIFSILVSVSILAAITLSLTGGFFASFANPGQEATFEPVGTLVVPTLDLELFLPTREPPAFFVTPTQGCVQQPGQYQVIVDTPPWMALTATPAPLPQPRSQTDLLRELLIGLLVLLGVALVFWLISLVAHWSLKRERQAALQRQPPPDPPLIDRVRPAVVRQDLPSAPPWGGGALAQPTPGVGFSEKLTTGIQQVRQGQLDAGIQNLVPVVQAHPQEADAWLWLGLAYTGKKEWATAERCLRLAEKLNHPQAAQALGMVIKLSAR